MNYNPFLHAPKKELAFCIIHSITEDQSRDKNVRKQPKIRTTKWSATLKASETNSKLNMHIIGLDRKYLMF